MTNLLYLVISIILFIRIRQFIVGKRNEKWLLKQGGIYTHRNWDLWCQFFYGFFYMAILGELIVKQFLIVHHHYLFMLLLVLVQLFRWWLFDSLGKFWTIKTIKIPNVIILKHGIFKYFNNPLPIIVSFEIMLIPLILNTYVTALIFPLLYIIVASIWIPKHDRVLINHI